MATKTNTITIIILAALLVMAGAYIGYDKYNEAKTKENQGILERGAEIGYRQAITQIYSQARTCQQVPVYIENQTLNLIAIECLQQLQQQAQQTTGQA